MHALAKPRTALERQRTRAVKGFTALVNRRTTSVKALWGRCGGEGRAACGVRGGASAGAGAGAGEGEGEGEELGWGS